MKSLLLTVVLSLGIIDQIYDNYAVIEYETPSGNLKYIDIPTDIIPCQIKEGDKIRFSKSSKRTKIFCKN